MSITVLFYIIISILILQYLVDTILAALNAKKFDDPIPDELSDVYDSEEYLKSQAYKKRNYIFGKYTAVFSVTLLLSFIFLGGFEIVDNFSRSFSDNDISIALIFFGTILIGSDIINIPFSYYQTFVIEEEFGFNKTSLKTFIIDKIKGWIMTIVIGGGLLALVIWFYKSTGTYFWVYTWALITVFMVFMNMFYSKLIVPLFNKQSPLKDGELKEAIELYATKVGFKLKNIFVIDGSKRSTKANAYFSGFGNEKQITLFDTLINDLKEEEIVAVLAHEVGHYKKKHIIFNIFASVILMGITLFLLSLFINTPELSLVLGVSKPSFHIALITFGILYAPISEVTGLIMNYFSRKFEYQADNYAKETYKAAPLISSLKKLSKNNLSNLTPHPIYVLMHYSHPTLLQRIHKLKQ